MPWDMNTTSPVLPDMLLVVSTVVDSNAAVDGEKCCSMGV